MRRPSLPDTLVFYNGGNAGLAFTLGRLLQVSDLQAKAAMGGSVALLLALAFADLSIPSIQISMIALIPLGIFVWFSNSRVAYPLAAATALIFTYIDDTFPPAPALNVPLDAAFTLISYLAVTAIILMARRAFADAVTLRQQLAITSETASIQRWLADHDPLTSAANRRAFKKAMMEAMAGAGLSSSALGIVVGDIDDFKAVNTKYGQRFGDRLLCTLFSRLQSVCGDDTFVGRLDGDEFAIIFPQISSDWSLFKTANELAHELSAPYHIEGRDLRIGITLATAMYPAEAQDADLLIEVAEKKVYDAKRYGAG